MDPSDLPDLNLLRRRHEALAAVEALLSSEPPGGRYYGSEPPERYWFDSGSGDSYDLVIVGDDALLTVFDHESPRSPWGRDDGAPEWPGMFVGLPDRLRERLPDPDPDRDDDEPLSVSACFWFVDGKWNEGQPEPIERDGDAYDSDPGGAAGLLRQLLDPEAEARELVESVFEEPERLDEVLAIVRHATDD